MRDQHQDWRPSVSEAGQAEPELPEELERYRIVAPVLFQWRSGAAIWHEGRGTTRYISGTGLFVLSYPVPVPGAAIKVTVEIPPVGRLITPVVLHGEGTVIRVEPEQGQPIGFEACLVLDFSKRSYLQKP